MNADIDFSSDRICHRRLLLEFFLGSLLGTELPRCATKSKGIDLAESRLDTVHRLTHREGKSSDLGNFYGTSSRRNIDSRLRPFVSSLQILFVILPRDFCSPQESSYFVEVLKILHSLDISARTVGSGQSSSRRCSTMARRSDQEARSVEINRITRRIVFQMLPHVFSRSTNISPN